MARHVQHAVDAGVAAGKPFEAGLREFLEAFRLPGESQKIDRVLEAFALRYWAQTTHDTLFKSADAVHILAFSAVLLNTDLHNSGVRACGAGPLA